MRWSSAQSSEAEECTRVLLAALAFVTDSSLGSANALKGLSVGSALHPSAAYFIVAFEASLRGSAVKVNALFHRRVQQAFALMAQLDAGDPSTDLSAVYPTDWPEPVVVEPAPAPAEDGEVSELEAAEAAAFAEMAAFAAGDDEEEAEVRGALLQEEVRG